MKERTLTLYKSQVHKDVDKLTYKLSEGTSEGIIKDVIASDSEDGLDGALIDIYIDNRFTELRKLLGFCLKDELILSLNNERDLSDKIDFILVLPDEFKDKTLREAISYMHQYVVKGVLLDWYTNIGSSYGSPLVAEVETMKNKVLDILRSQHFVKKSTPKLYSFKIR